MTPPPWLHRLLNFLGLRRQRPGQRPPHRPSTRPAPDPHASAKSRPAKAAHPEPPPALPSRASRSRSGRSILSSSSIAPGQIDRVETMIVIHEGQHEELLWKLSQRIEQGRFKVPQLPSTGMAAMQLCSRSSADVDEITRLITSDPLLSGELLRMANSVMYATVEPAATLHQAIMRVGLRALRGLILSASMRGVLLNTKGLRLYAREVWRQSLSVALIARGIAGPLGFDREKAYALGLLHDVGKVALLALLAREVHTSSEVTPAVVGSMFLSLHERAGEAMATAWSLPEEIAAVAGCHHDPDANLEYPRSAALARLAHLIDLRLSLDDEAGFLELVDSLTFETLGVPEEQRMEILELGRAAHDEAQEVAVENLVGAAP